MTRFQTIMKQIAKLASEAAGMSTGEEHFAARDIKYAAEAAASISEPETRHSAHVTHHFHD